MASSVAKSWAISGSDVAESFKKASGHEGKEFLRAAAVAATEKMKDRKEYFAGQARLCTKWIEVGRQILGFWKPQKRHVVWVLTELVHTRIYGNLDGETYS